MATPLQLQRDINAALNDALVAAKERIHDAVYKDSSEDAAANAAALAAKDAEIAALKARVAELEGGQVEPPPVEPPPVDPPPVDPPVAGLPAGAVTAIADVMALSASNTGCRRTNLTNSSGTGSVRDGQVFEGLRINGRFTCGHKNVVLRDCIIDGDVYYAVLSDDRQPVGDGLTLEYCTITGSTNAVAGVIKLMYRCNIYGVDNGMNLWAGGLFVNNYIHDLKSQEPGGHNDGIENNGCSGMLLLYNKIVCSPENDTAAVMTNNEFGSIRDGMIQGNYLEGGQYTVYADDRKKPGNALKFTLRDNTIKKGRYGHFALYTSDVTQINNTLI